MANKILTSDMLKKFREELKSFSTDEEKAFLYWFIKAYFGKNSGEDATVKITDGENDGEIDAIIFDGEYTYVIQSKYSASPFVDKATVLPIGDYAKFDNTISSFENKEKFEEYLETVEDDLKHHYRRLFEKYHDDKDKVFWYHISFHKPSNSGEKRINNKDRIKFYYWNDVLDLYHLDLEGGTPLAKPLDLRYINQVEIEDKEKHINSYVAQVILEDFIKYVRNYDPNLLIISRNVRNDLRSKINDGIRRTFEKFPDEFWYSHNGITIICDKVVRLGKMYRISHPNIINGSQTINSIKNEPIENKDTTVLVRITEIPSTLADSKDLIEKIIFRTNNQNKMYAWDLKANDPLLVSIAKKMRDFKIYFSRRRGDWESQQRENLHKGLKNLKSQELALILVSCIKNIGGTNGILLGKASTESLFQIDQYFKNIFGRDFKEIFFKYNIYKLVFDVLGNIYYRKTKTTERRIAKYVITGLIYDSIKNNKQLTHWFARNFEDSIKLSKKNKKIKDLIFIIQSLFKELWDKYRKEEKENPSLYPSDFFSKSKKYNDIFFDRIEPKYKIRIEKAFEKTFS